MTELIAEATSLGAAGLIGTLWLMERSAARTREKQLEEAHARILQDRVALTQLIEVVRQNTEALTRLAERIGK
jgi:hypothetical protein